MLICEVTGHVWATKKENTLSGMKLMVVRELAQDDKETNHTFVAADIVGAGIGERVLVVNGSTARKAFGDREPAVDATIVGIIDSVQM
ncbi:Carbon dioxide concentrating mechanism protein CcmL [uncultured Roseburia sp.]|uniref:EutN/CcmL family microcompartment protein n=1 Tax=Brotonthovivens ammoniilytica TaxID=2981725 RepID=A0ABT2TFX8_9FIRM|nr:EutN/CcmL family microcompartment protein [Brotonthovivens ammoniilytica]MCU6760796.1 EutN/CcmL family microcompartment protein [Brotonthovivens ammoniilytica]SCI09568.1 Carbon dioxide concentrating mechanism protein CcmL [uncultured Roseburia sp.]